MYTSRVSRLKHKISTNVQWPFYNIFRNRFCTNTATQDEHNIFGISDRFLSVAIVVYNFIIIQRSQRKRDCA